MAKKAELEENKVKEKKVASKKNPTKKKDAEKKVVKDTKTSKKVVKEKKEEPVKEVTEVKETVSSQVIVKDNTKRNVIIKRVIYSLILLLVVGAFIYSIIESSNRVDTFKSVSFNEVTELMKEDELNIVYWASPNCGYCVQFTPIVKKVASANSVEINYLNAEELNNEDYIKFMGYVSEFDKTYESKSLGTPSLILFKNGKVTDISVGALSERGFVSYLQTNGFIK